MEGWLGGGCEDDGSWCCLSCSHSPSPPLHHVNVDHGSWIMDHQPIGCHGHGRRCHDRFLQLFIPFHRWSMVQFLHPLIGWSWQRWPPFHSNSNSNWDDECWYPLPVTMVSMPIVMIIPFQHWTLFSWCIPWGGGEWEWDGDTWRGDGDVVAIAGGVVLVDWLMGYRFAWLSNHRVINLLFLFQHIITTSATYERNPIDTQRTTNNEENNGRGEWEIRLWNEWDDCERRKWKNEKTKAISLECECVWWWWCELHSIFTSSSLSLQQDHKRPTLKNIQINGILPSIMRSICSIRINKFHN